MTGIQEQLEALLTETKKLHERNELSKTVGPEWYEPGKMEYLEQSDSLWEPETGCLTLHFESRGTRYDGRSELIEHLHVGDPITLHRDPKNPYNPNNFIIMTQRNEDVGNMPAELCNVIAPLYDAGILNFDSAEVSFLEPLSQRSRHARQAVLFVRVICNVCT